MSDKPETLDAVLGMEYNGAEGHETDTVASIVAEMRETWMDTPPCILSDLADRIEAAAARERDEDRQLAAIAESDEAFARCARCDRPERAPGNAAEMRAALNRVGHLAKDLRNITDRDTEVRADVNEIVDVCRAALAAPARNCDRFATAEEAVASFADHLRAWENAHGICSEYPDHAVQVPAGAFSWLFAPAEEGEDHA